MPERRPKAKSNIVAPPLVGGATLRACHIRRAARPRPTAEFALAAVLSDTDGERGRQSRTSWCCVYILCGMADEVGRHARQVVGQIVVEIRDDSVLLGPG